jgi:hypothetical protein
MGVADGASGSSSQSSNGLRIIGGSTPSGSPQPCWWDKATRGNGELSMVRDLRRKPETQTATNTNKEAPAISGGG